MFIVYLGNKYKDFLSKHMSSFSPHPRTYNMTSVHEQLPLTTSAEKLAQSCIVIKDGKRCRKKRALTASKDDHELQEEYANVVDRVTMEVQQLGDEERQAAARKFADHHTCKACAAEGMTPLVEAEVLREMDGTMDPPKRKRRRLQSPPLVQPQTLPVQQNLQSAIQPQINSTEVDAANETDSDERVGDTDDSKTELKTPMQYSDTASPLDPSSSLASQDTGTPKIEHPNDEDSLTSETSIVCSTNLLNNAFETYLQQSVKEELDYPEDRYAGVADNVDGKDINLVHSLDILDAGPEVDSGITTLQDPVSSYERSSQHLLEDTVSLTETDTAHDIKTPQYRLQCSMRSSTRSPTPQTSLSVAATPSAPRLAIRSRNVIEATKTSNIPAATYTAPLRPPHARHNPYEKLDEPRREEERQLIDSLVQGSSPF